MSLSIFPQPQSALHKDRTAEGHRPADQRSSDQHKPAGTGFRDLLGGSGDAGPNGPARDRLIAADMDTGGWSGLEGGIDFEAAAQRFNLTLAADNRAIAFDARPIVGPASIDADVSQRPFQDDFHRTFETGGHRAGLKRAALLPTAAAFNQMPQPGQLTVSTATAGPRAGGAVIGQTAKFGASPVAPSLVTPTGPAMASVPQGKTSQPAISSGTANGSAPAQFSAPLNTRAQLLAQLLTTTDEYRVVVRGTTLGRAEELDLAKAIRSVLRAQGLPDRPIVVSVMDRRD